MGTASSSPPEPSAPQWPSALPYPWASVDLGGPSVPGSASGEGETFDVTGAGFDIWGSSDQFHFMFQSFTGDVDIVAKVAGIQLADLWSKGGVMIRESLTPESPHALMLLSAGSGAAFQRRASAGGGTDNTSGCACSAPTWVRLVRSGNLLNAYESSDGADWRLVGNASIAMSPTVYVGLAVTSHNTEAAASATFTNVMIGAPAGGVAAGGAPVIDTPVINTPAIDGQANITPSVTLLEPWSGAVFGWPATITLSADASDADGTIARVDFYADQQFLGAASYPFWMTWSNAPAGMYGLTAVATDNAGATATSQSVIVTVNASPPVDLVESYRPSTLLFGPSANHDDATDFYLVELRRAGEGTWLEPLATRNLGKPPVANGEISVDVSEMVDGVPAGSYYAVVVTVGPGGATPSAPSPPFFK
jgi:regulation of enolase protein 1 (concanavalin A-like superfamily)